MRLCPNNKLQRTRYIGLRPLPHVAEPTRCPDSERGHALYGRRMATMEPVFGDLRACKRSDRFTLLEQAKVNTQWHLYCLVHNIEKLAYHGYGNWPGAAAEKPL